MNTIGAVHWKFRDNPHGLRFFSSEKQAQKMGEDLAKLSIVGGVLCKWPSELGPIPNDATISQWDAEYVEARDIDTKKQAAILAIEFLNRENQLNAALNDPNAPQAVKDYKAVKK